MKQKRLMGQILISAMLLLAGAALMWAGFAAFTSATDSGQSSLTAGTLTLGRNAAISGTVTALKPGDSVSRCVKVTNSGSIDANVTVAMGGQSDGSGTLTNTFPNNVVLYAVEQGTWTGNDTTTSCTGFTASGDVLGATTAGAPSGQLDSNGSTATAKSASLSGGIAAGTTKAFRVTFLLPSSADNSSAGKSLAYYVAFNGTSPAGTSR